MYHYEIQVYTYYECSANPFWGCFFTAYDLADILFIFVYIHVNEVTGTTSKS